MNISALTVFLIPRSCTAGIICNQSGSSVTCRVNGDTVLPTPACALYETLKNIAENVPLVQFVYLVFTRMPSGVTVGDSGLCCCVPCLSSALISLCLLILDLRHFVIQNVLPLTD